VHALNNTSVIEYEGWTLRVRDWVTPPSRLMLMLHGWTGDENSMLVFANNFPQNYLVLAPRGIYISPNGGYSWRIIPDGSVGRPSLNELQDSAHALIQLIDSDPARAGVDASQFDVMGFSQGAALSNVLACLYPQRVRRVGILAGFMPEGMESLVAQRPLEGKPVFVTHGLQDNMVPISVAHASLALLEQAGAQVAYCEAEVGHKVSAECLRALQAFFQD